MFKGCLKFPGCFKEVSRMFQGSFKGVFRKFQECFHEVSRLFHGSFKSVSRKFQERFKEVSGKFQGCHCLAKNVNFVKKF